MFIINTHLTGDLIQEYRRVTNQLDEVSESSDYVPYINDFITSSLNFLFDPMHSLTSFDAILLAMIEDVTSYLPDYFNDIMLLDAKGTVMVR